MGIPGRYGLALVLLSVACSQEVATGQRCGGKHACAGGDDAPDGGAHDFAGSGPGGAGQGAVGSAENELAVHVEDARGMTIEIITLACAGDCADIEAVASGGHPPYTLAWEDGSTQAQRHVCLDASTTLTVSATDTPITTAEFEHDAQTATANVTATVLDCSDASVPECEADAAVDETLTPDILGTPGFFANGAVFPAGRYRLTYVDGCMKYDASWFWTVQGSPTFQFEIIRDDKVNVVAVAPGTAAPISFGVGGGYMSFDDCVTANLALAPLDFDFPGGKLGLWQNDFKPEDNLGGDNGRSPTWRLTRVCP